MAVFDHPSFEPGFAHWIRIRLEVQVLQLAAQHHDRAVPAVIAGVGELEGVGARDLQLAVVVAPEAQARERNGVVEELQR